MLHDLNRTLEKLLIERGKIDKGEIDIAFELPNAEWASRLARPSINCWCYDLRENVKLRNMEMNVTRNQDTRRATLRLPPRRYDVTYLVTAWARRVEDEHQLLWRALGALAQNTVLTPDDCEGELREQPYELPMQLAQQGETGVNITDLWSVLQSEMRLGFNLVVTLALDTQRVFDTPLVLEAQFGVGQRADAPKRELQARDREFVIRQKRESDDNGSD
jgi:hypothetical protein